MLKCQTISFDRHQVNSANSRLLIHPVFIYFTIYVTNSLTEVEIFMVQRIHRNFQWNWSRGATKEFSPNFLFAAEENKIFMDHKL